MIRRPVCDIDKAGTNVGVRAQNNIRKAAAYGRIDKVKWDVLTKKRGIKAPARLDINCS
jgi:hypothetical protein